MTRGIACTRRGIIVYRGPGEKFRLTLGRCDDLKVPPARPPVTARTGLIVLPSTRHIVRTQRKVLRRSALDPCRQTEATWCNRATDLRTSLLNWMYRQREGAFNEEEKSLSCAKSCCCARQLSSCWLRIFLGCRGPQRDEEEEGEGRENVVDVVGLGSALGRATKAVLLTKQPAHTDKLTNK